jgi:hypothetical protein
MLRTRSQRAASATPLLRRGNLGKGAMIAALLLASLQSSSAQLMSLPGDFGVTPTGGAHYTIPIVVAPGTAGMVPSLSLEYSSETGGSSNGWLGAGLLGVGWTLAGLPAIGRCPQTVAQDGVVGSITYTSTDRFCFEGQRLVAISGNYGADGTQYRTEIESFSLIISHGVVGTGSAAGPAWWEVHTKAGQVMQFGNTADSRILAPSTGAARSWAVNQVSDTKGNYYSVIYNNDTTNGQAYPVTINYTANAIAGLQPYNSVQFTYSPPPPSSSARPDIVPIYQAGSLMKTTVRLTNVQTYAGTQLVRNYTLAYQQGSTTGRSQLSSVTLCGGDGTCLPATTFTWQNGTTTPTAIHNVGNQDTQLVGSRPYLANFTGSGMTSVMWDLGGDPVFPYSAGYRVLWNFDSFSANTNQITPGSDFLGQDRTLIGDIPIVADFNRDGRSDVWWYQVNIDPSRTYDYAGGSTVTWLSTGDGTYAIAPGPAAPTNVPTVLLAADDINGDGRTDLYWMNQTNQPKGSPLSADVFQWAGPNGSSLGVNSAVSVLSAQSSCPNAGVGNFLTALAADFNGDGFSDLLWVPHPYMSRGQTQNCGAPLFWFGLGNGGFNVPSPVGGVTGYTPYLGDFNGDGKMDILWDLPDSSGRSSGTRVLWLSMGNGSFAINSNPGGLNGQMSGYVPTIADFNGDGIADILWTQVDTNGLSNGAMVLWLGQGNGNFTVISNVGGQNGTLIGYVPYVGDFNGDGKADVLWDSRTPGDSRSTGHRTLWLSDGVPPDLMTGITTGIGATIGVTYQSITAGPPLYTKGTTATDPTVDLKGSMQVVSQVTRSNGIGGTVSTAYTYATAQMDNNGRGFLGFQTVTATDLQTNIVETMTYLQTYPYIMQQASDTKMLNGTTLSTTTNTYASNSLTPAGVGGTREQLLLNQTVTGGNDLGGYALPTTTTSYAYDAYNNATQIAVSVNDGSTKTTNNTFYNDTTISNGTQHWFLGRLTNSSVTSTAPVGSSP